MATKKLPLVVLISGSGSNLQAIIDQAAGDLPVEIRAVISNREDAYGLERARKAGIETRVLDHKPYPDRDSYDQALIELIDEFQPGAVALAGFMRILSAGFVHHYRGRLFNIHPSLLPKYRGLHTHRKALEAGEKIHGASVHFVTEELDGGPLVLQVRVPVEESDTEESLGARVLTQEHVIYPQVLRWFAEGRIQMGNDHLVMDGEVRNGPVVIDYQQDPRTL
ncbi:phosphoribosylglycinamide formyltransferase [Pseudomonadota bacterium]